MSVPKNESLLPVRAELGRERTGLAVLVEIDHNIKMDGAQRDETLQSPWENVIDDGGYDFRRVRKPGDTGAGIDFLEFSQERRCPNDVADRAQFDQKDPAVRGIIECAVRSGLINAVNAMRFVGSAGDVAAEVPAIRFQGDHASSYFSCSRMEWR
jgi:hypothetical protein